MFTMKAQENNLSSINYLQIYNTSRTDTGILNLGGTSFYNTNLNMRNIKYIILRPKIL